MDSATAFAAIRAHCLGKPDATEDYPWGETVWKVGGKVFCFSGGTGFTIKSTLEKQAALVMHPSISVAKFVGRFGWVSVVIKDEDTLELALELIDESYDSIVLKRRKVRVRAPGS